MAAATILVVLNLLMAAVEMGTAGVMVVAMAGVVVAETDLFNHRGKIHRLGRWVACLQDNSLLHLLDNA